MWLRPKDPKRNPWPPPAFPNPILVATRSVLRGSCARLGPSGHVGQTQGEVSTEPRGSPPHPAVRPRPPPGPRPSVAGSPPTVARCQRVPWPPGLQQLLTADAGARPGAGAASPQPSPAREASSPHGCPCVVTPAPGSLAARVLVSLCPGPGRGHLRAARSTAQQVQRPGWHRRALEPVPRAPGQVCVPTACPCSCPRSCVQHPAFLSHPLPWPQSKALISCQVLPTLGPWG